MVRVIGEVLGDKGLRKELIKRGLKNEIKQEKRWIKENWINYYKSKFPEKESNFIKFIFSYPFS